MTTYNQIGADMKQTFIAISIAAFTLIGFQSSAIAGGQKHCESKAKKCSTEMPQSASFFKDLAHASFMPNIMKHIKKNKAQLKITSEQMQKFEDYHQANSPKVKTMVQDLMWTEQKAEKLALNNFPPEQVIELGELSLKIRHDIMMRKVKCRTFIKSVLTPDQYKQALTSYGK